MRYIKHKESEIVVDLVELKTEKLKTGNYDRARLYHKAPNKAFLFANDDAPLVPCYTLEVDFSLIAMLEYDCADVETDFTSDELKLMHHEFRHLANMYKKEPYLSLYQKIETKIKDLRRKEYEGY